MVIYSLPGHRWAQSSNRCPGCNLLEIFASENFELINSSLEHQGLWAEGKPGLFLLHPLRQMPSRECCRFCLVPPWSALRWEAKHWSKSRNGLWELPAQLPVFLTSISSTREFSLCLFHAQELQSSSKTQHLFPKEQTGNWEKPPLMQSTRWHMAPT